MIGGQSQLKPAPRLHWTAGNVKGKASLQVLADPADKYIVETSEDLVHWKAFTKAAGSAEFLIQPSISVGKQFYRLRFVVE